MNKSSPGGLVLGRFSMSILYWLAWALLVLVIPVNYTDNPPRSYYPMQKVSGDLRSLRTAIEAYAVDHNAYPWPAPRLQSRTNSTTERVPFWLPNILTSPVSYIQALPEDLMAMKFGTSDRAEAYVFLTRDYLQSVKGNRIEVPGYPGRYLNVGGEKFIEDFDFHFGAYILASWGRRGPYQWQDGVNFWTAYDSTNGTNSFGVILTSQKRMEYRSSIPAKFQPTSQPFDHSAEPRREIVFVDPYRGDWLGEHISVWLPVPFLLIWSFLPLLRNRRDVDVSEV